MNVDRAVFAFAGVMLLISLILTTQVSAGFIWFTAFIAVNMIQSSFTGFCPAAIIFKKLGLEPGHAFK